MNPGKKGRPLSGGEFRFSDVRERLNQQPFRHGVRSISVGFADALPPLSELESECLRHGLQLVQGDGNEVFVQQRLRRGAIDLAWLGAGLSWAYRIIAIGLTMFLPGLAGNWLDQRWGVSGFTALGFLLGLAAGIWQIVRLARASKPDA